MGVQTADFGGGVYSQDTQLMVAPLNISMAVILMALTAFGYAMATVGMKVASGGVNAPALALISVGLGVAVLAEVVLLRHADLEVIYIGIVVVESLLVLAYAAHVGGPLTSPQILGAGMVLGGFALVTLGN